jgi:hypothetical protein
MPRRAPVELMKTPTSSFCVDIFGTQPKRNLFILYPDGGHALYRAGGEVCYGSTAFNEKRSIRHIKKAKKIFAFY